MKNVHFAIPEIYGETLSYYELLRKLVDKTNDLIENYNTVPEQIADAVKNLDAAQLFSAVLDQLIDTIATDNTKSNNAVKVYKKHDLLYATFNENVNLYESMIDFTPGTETELIPGTNIREVNISELFIELRKLIDINKNNIEAVTSVANENSAEIATMHNAITGIENKNTEQDNELSTLRTMISSPYNFKGEVASISALPASGEVNDTYYVQDVKYKVTWTGSAWVQSSLSEADYETELSELKGDLGNKSNLNTDNKTNVVNAINEVNNRFLAPVSDSVENWLNAHPEATTTVQDGSLTYKKLVKGTLGYVTPEMFGAVGDGVTDDTIAINLAIQTEKAVLFSNKIYLLKDILIENKKVCLFGNSTTLKFANNTNNKKWISFVNCNDIIVTGFTFNGNRDNQTIISSGPSNKHTENCPVILFDKTENAYVYNCYFYNCQGDGIQIDKLYYNQEATDYNYSKNIHIYDNKFDKIGRNGVSVAHCDTCFIHGNAFNNLKNYSSTISCGVDVEPNPDYHFISKNIIIYDNIFNNCEFGINLSLASDYCSNVKVYNNSIFSSILNEYGIYIVCKPNAKDIEVSNNNVYGHTFGIYSSYCYNTIISENKIYAEKNDISTAGGGIGIYIITAKNCSIINNVIISNGIYSIFSSIITNSIITKNLLKGDNSNGYSMLFNEATNLYITNNQFNENKFPINSNTKTTDCTIVNNNLLGENKGINLENQSNIVIYNNYTKRNVSTINHTSSTTDYEYTGLSITIPANAEYILNASVSWNESEPNGLVFSDSSENMNNVMSAEGKNSTIYSGYTPLSSTLYLWAKYKNAGATNPCILRSSITV